MAKFAEAKVADIQQVKEERPVKFEVESTFHARWVAENGERLCSSCYVLGASRIVDGQVLCQFCVDHKFGKKLKA